MAKLSFACKYEGTCTWPGFSESEIDVARQLIKLCSLVDHVDNHKIINIDDNMGLTGKRRRVNQDFDNDFCTASAVAMLEDDEHLKPRKRKSRSISYIYKSTKPLVAFDAKKICCS